MSQTRYQVAEWWEDKGQNGRRWLVVDVLSTHARLESARAAVPKDAQAIEVDRPLIGQIGPTYLGYAAMGPRLYSIIKSERG